MNIGSSTCAISADGGSVAFVYTPGNDVDVYVSDLQAATMECVSLAPDGTMGNGGDIERISISADGRFVVFDSTATNLVSGVSTGYWQVYMHDRQAGTTECPAYAPNGKAGNDGSIGPSISADGRFVAFCSFATNLIPNIMWNGQGQVYMRDLQTGAIECLSLDPDGTPAEYGGFSPSVSADGRFVTFTAKGNLIPGVSNDQEQIYLIDRGNVLLAGLASDGSIWYTSDLKSWAQVPGHLSAMCVGDTYVQGQHDIVGLSDGGSIWQTTDESSWNNVVGSLSGMALGDLTGGGKADIAGLTTDGSIVYTTDNAHWTQIPGKLSTLVTGDFTGTGKDGLAGTASDGSIWYTTDLKTWSHIPGKLTQISAGDFNGVKKAGLAGVAADSTVWYTTDESNWTKIPGYLTQLVTGDFDGDGKDDLAGLAPDGSVWYTTDKASWTQIPGHLTSLVASDLNGDGKADLAGLASDGSIWYTTDLKTWNSIPGKLTKLYAK
jgi:hypothetical protein